MRRYRNKSGKWVNRSTGVCEETEARRIADSWEIDAAREREQGRVEVSPAGISDTIARAERLARQGRLDATAGRELLNSLLVAAGGEKLGLVTSRTCCDDWKKGKEGVVKARSKMKYDQVVRDWLACLSSKADKPMDLVTKSDSLAFRDKLVASALAARTVNQTMKLLRGIYQDAVEQGHIGRNPFVGIGSQRQDRDEVGREPFSVGEVVKLIEAAEGDWKGLVILAATSGLRLMDAARLKWSALDFEGEVIRIRTAKTGAKLTLPIHPEFAEWLAEQQRGIGAAPVFSTLGHKSGAGKSGLSQAFRRLMGRAEISAGVARLATEKGRGRTTSRKSFHSLRHFAVTQLAIGGVRAEVARQITGHADAESHANYINADQDALRAAVRGIKLSA